MPRPIYSTLVLAAGSLLALVSGAPAAPHPVIQNLLDPETRMEAFFEAAQAHEGLVDERAMGDRRVFSKFCRELNIIVCPQGDDSPANLYLVIYRPDHEATRASAIHQSNRDYPRERYDRLFPQTPPAPPGDAAGHASPADPLLAPSLESLSNQAFAVFDDAGRVVDLSFIDNDTRDNDVIFDLNDDGILEWAESSRYEVGGSANKKRPHLLIVRTVTRSPEMLFAVIYNWHAPDQAPGNEWGFRFSDEEGGGPARLSLGPLTSDGIEPQVTYRWNDTTRTYEGPPGGRGEHFKVLDPTTPLAEQISPLWRLGGLKYQIHDAPPAPPPETGSPDARPAVDGNSNHPVLYDPDKYTHPYRNVSLKNLTHEQILEYMCGGRTLSDLQRELRQDTRLPPDFWLLPAKDAALRYADVNRSDRHREQFRLALDDLDDVRPPAGGAIQFRDDGHGGGARQFLRFDPGPGPSYLVTSRDNPVLERVGHLYTPSGPAASLTLRELDDALAQQLFEIAWWLDRIRSRSLSASSQADPDPTLTAAVPAFNSRGPANEITEVIFTAPASEGSRVSRRGYAPVSGLGAIWSGDFNHDVFLTLTKNLLLNEVPQYLDLNKEPAPSGESPTEEHLRLQNLTRLTGILEEWDKGASDFPEEIAGDAIASAGYLGLVELLPALQEIQRERALTQLEFEPGPASLFEEKSFQEKLAIAVAQLESAGDVDRIESLARMNAPASAWAALQLRQEHPARYQAILEHWLTITEGHDRNQVQETLTRLLAQSGESPAAVKPAPGSIQDAMATLENSTTAGGDSPGLTAAVIGLATQLKNESAWSDQPSRLHALRLLVPPDDPRRHRDLAIDETLTTLLQSSPDAALRQAASLALAWRLEQDAWNILWGPFAAPPSPHDSPLPGMGQGSLEALTYIAAKHGDPYRNALLGLVRNALASGDLKLGRLFHTIFELDFRELQANLEDLATSNSSDYEGDPDAAWLKNGGPPHRYHLPRRILALWNEKAAPTRAKLLLALGLSQSHAPSVNAGKAMDDRLERELNLIALSLSFQEKLAVIDFINWVEENGRETLKGLNQPLGSPQLAFLAHHRNRLLP